MEDNLTFESVPNLLPLELRSFFPIRSGLVYDYAGDGCLLLALAEPAHLSWCAEYEPDQDAASNRQASEEERDPFPLKLLVRNNYLGL